MQIFPLNVMSRKNCRSKKHERVNFHLKREINIYIFYFTPGRVTEREMRETFQSGVDVRDGTFVESLGFLLKLVVA